MEWSQNWQYTKKFPKGKPIFFENGKRVKLEVGYGFVKDGIFGEAPTLREWFDNNMDELKLGVKQ